MSLWIVGILLVALFGAMGYFLGSIRTVVVLVGLWLSALLAKAVGAPMAGLVPKLGFENPIWLVYLPPVLGFLVMFLVFAVAAFVVHHLLHRQYRNSTDEYTYARWERLNRRTGVGAGAAAGVVAWVLVSAVAYVPGYLTTQIEGSEEASMAVKFANGMTTSARNSGLQRLIERFQPAAPEHFQAADVLGLIYQNPAAHARLASYPPFLGLAEAHPELADLGRDPGVQTAIQSKAGFTGLMEQDRIRAVLENHEVVQSLMGLNYADLEGYLRTGVSEVYRGEPALGRWRLNVRRSIAEMRTTPSSQLSATEFNLIRKALNVYLEEMNVGFTTDNRVLLRVKARDEERLQASAGRAPAGGGDAGGESAAGSGGGLTARGLAARAMPQPQEGQSTADLYRDRYGIAGPGGGGAGGGGVAGGPPGAVPLSSITSVASPRVVARASATTTLGPILNSGDGQWTRDGDIYRVRFSNEGQEVNLEARVKDRYLIFTMDGRTLVFNRI